MLGSPVGRRFATNSRKYDKRTAPVKDDVAVAGAVVGLSGRDDAKEHQEGIVIGLL